MATLKYPPPTEGIQMLEVFQRTGRLHCHLYIIVKVISSKIGIYEIEEWHSGHLCKIHTNKTAAFIKNAQLPVVFNNLL